MLDRLRRAAARLAVVAGLPLVVGCAGSSAGTGSATGLAGGAIGCPEGPRHTLDCRGVLAQFARDLKADLNAMAKVQAGAAVTTTKLIEADALSADIIQQHYQTCSLYNACVISRRDFSAKMDRLHRMQLEIRRVLATGGITAIAAQQNIQIGAPPVGGGDAGGSYPPAGGDFSSGSDFSSGGDVSSGGSDVSSDSSEFSTGGTDVDSGGAIPPSEPVDTSTSEPSTPGSTDGRPASVTTQLDAVLDALRTGAGAERGRSSTGGPGTDLDGALRSMLSTLKQGIAARDPARAAGRAVVANVTQKNQPFSGALGTVLQERLQGVVQGGAVFAPPARTRGVTIKEVSGTARPNEPGALPAMYGSDIAIAGTYQVQGERIDLELTAVDPDGRPLAQAASAIPTAAVPAVPTTPPDNAGDTTALLQAIESQLGPRARGEARVEVTTSRPGAGASYQLGEEIRYFVTSTTDGYLYLFHVDADNAATQLYPNEFQPEARIRRGAALEVPPAGAPFRLEASPPFGLETTVAIVTSTALDVGALEAIGRGLSHPAQGTLRGVAVRPAAGAGAGTSRSLVWNAVTVLVRP